MEPKGRSVIYISVALSQGQDGGHPFDPNKLMQQFMQMRTDQNVFGSYNPIDVKEAAKAYFQKTPPLGGMLQTGNINAELNGFDPNGQSMFAGHQSEIWKFASSYNPNKNIHKYVSESTDVGSLGSIHTTKEELNQGMPDESHSNNNLGANTLISNLVPSTEKHNFGLGVGTPSTFSLPISSMHMPKPVANPMSGTTDTEHGFNPNHLNHELFQNLGYNPEAVMSETILPHHNPMASIGQGTAHPLQNLEIGNNGMTHNGGKMNQDGGTVGKQTDGTTMNEIKDGGTALAGAQNGETLHSGASTQNTGTTLTGTGSLIQNGGSVSQSTSSKIPNGGIQAGVTATQNSGTEKQNGGSTNQNIGTETQNGGTVSQNGGVGTHNGGTAQNIGTETYNGGSANQNGGNSGSQNGGTVTQNRGQNTGSAIQSSNQPKYHIVLNSNGEHVLVQSTDEPGKYIVIKTISNEKLANYLIAKLSSSIRNGSPVPSSLSALMSVQKTPKLPSNFNEESAQPAKEGSLLNGYHVVSKEQIGATQAIHASGIGGLGDEHVGQMQKVFGIGSLGEGSQSRGPQKGPVDSASSFSMNQVNTNPYVHVTGIGTLGSNSQLQLPGLESDEIAHATGIGSLGHQYGGEH
ncbi:uncharacterized protein LOC133196081 [Saccostrea echinata]|uniref:uncharacterized protein LOC133196081 n=1 Tax=Saccostrea echinata TaxID=191078 RepID=UPI002A7F98DC|nr:uncharacterized protein LOC133196081 [Saccostrea echinata]